MAGLLDVLAGMFGGQATPPQMQPNAQPESYQGTPMPQAPQQAQQMPPQRSGGLFGGGMRDTLRNLAPAIAMIDPRNQQMGMAMMAMNQNRRKEAAGQAQQNRTVQHLISQGVDPEEAAAIVSDPQTLRSWFGERAKAGKPDWQITEIYDEQGRPKKVLIDKNNPQSMQDLGGSKNEQTTLMQNIGAAGLVPGTPEYKKAILEGTRSGVNVDARNMGAVPQGYRVDYDDNGNPVSMSPIPGGPADTTAADAAMAENLGSSTDVITGAASKAREALKGAYLPVTGSFGSVLGRIPETAAAEVRRQVETLKSNAKIENLQAMRAASPTGGALGAVSDSENAMLAAKAGALDPNSPNFARDLDDYERSLLRTIHGKEAGDRIFNSTRQSMATEKDSGRKTSTGVQWSID